MFCLRIFEGQRKNFGRKANRSSGLFLRIHQELELGKVRIQTLKSTDAGVAFWWSAKEEQFTMQEI